MHTRRTTASDRGKRLTFRCVSLAAHRAAKRESLLNVTSDRKLKASSTDLLAKIERLSARTALEIAVYPFGLATVESRTLWMINMWVIHQVPSQSAVWGVKPRARAAACASTVVLVNANFSVDLCSESVRFCKRVVHRTVRLKWNVWFPLCSPGPFGFQKDDLFSFPDLRLKGKRTVSGRARLGREQK